MVPALLVAVMGASVASQQLPPGYVDPGPVLDAAAKAIGADRLKCVTISGTAYAGAVGQQRETARNVDWPRIEDLANYTRTMDWEKKNDAGGVRSQAWIEPRGLEIRGPLDRRAAAAAAPPDLCRRCRSRLAHGRALSRASRVDAGSRRDLSARHVAEPARLPESGPAAGRQSARDLEMGARRNGTGRPRSHSRKSHRGVDHRQRQVPRRRHDQQGAPAPANPHVGGRSRARRHELRTRVHQRQLRRCGQRHPVPDRLAFTSGVGRQLRRAGRERRAQRVRRDAEERQAESLPRRRRRARLGAPDDVRYPRRHAQARRWRLPARRGHPPQRGRRVPRLHCRVRGAAQRGAQPRCDRRDRQADPGQADQMADQLPSAFRSHRRASRLRPHRRDDRHAHHELQFLQARRVELRAADVEAGHGVVVAADRAGRRVLLRNHQGELRHQRRPAEPERLLRPSAAARRGHADGAPARRRAALRSGSGEHRSGCGGDADCRSAQPLQCSSEIEANVSQIVSVHGAPIPWSTIARTP